MSYLWLPLAIISYIIQSATNAIDRIIVHREVSKPIVVSFWAAAFSLATLGLLLIGLLPFAWAEQFRFQMPSPNIFMLVLVAGAMAQIGLFFSYRALHDGEVTKVASAIGAITPIITLVAAYIFLAERLGRLSILAFIVLVLGTIVLTHQSGKRQKGWFKFAFASAFFLAIQSVIAKYIFGEYHFISAFSLMALGAGIYALCLLVFSKDVQKQLSRKSKQRTRDTYWILANSLLGGLAIIILNLALKLGSATQVNALRGVQYAGIFVIALILSEKHSRLLDENLTKKSITQKLFGIILVIDGVILLALST